MWLKEAIPTLSSSRVGFNDARTIVNVQTNSAVLDSACVLRLESTTVIWSVGKPELRSRDITSIPLREVDAKGIHATKGAPKGLASSIEDQDVVIVPIWAGGKAIEDSTFFLQGKESGSYKMKVSEFRITAQDAPTAERIAEALRHAVTRCGGKVAPF